MRVNPLAKFIALLAEPVAALEGGQAAVGQLRSLSQALSSFGDLSVADLTTFLDMARGYRESGTLTPEHPKLSTFRQALDTLTKDLKSSADDAGVSSSQTAFAALVQTIAADHGIVFGKPKLDPKWLAQHRTQTSAASVIESIRELAGTIQDPAQLREDATAAAIDELATTDLAVLKHAVAELGGKVGSAKKPLPAADMVASAIAALKQFPTGKGKAGPAKPKASASEESVRSIVSDLQKLLEETGDYKSVPQSRIDDAIAGLDKGGYSVDQLVDIAFRVSGVKSGKSKKAAIGEIRASLTANRRAAESQTT